MKPTQSAVVAAGLIGLWSGLTGRAAAAGSAELRTTLEKWVETKSLISREAQEWRVGEVMLKDRIELVRRETESLRAQSARARQDIGEADQKLAELEAENEELKAATAGLATDVRRLEERVQVLLDKAPAPISNRVRPLSQRIPKDPGNTKLSLSERFQNVIGILNEFNKFSREITEAVEVRELPDGTSAEVTVLYLGLGRAYYSNAKGGAAGIGTLGPDGWVWESRDELVPQVEELIGVYRNERPAAYVLVPGEVN